MNRRFVLHLLTVIVFLNPLFFAGAWATHTYLWIGTNGNWEDAANWLNMDTGVDGVLPVADSDIMIDGNVAVTLNSSIIVESVQLSGGATLIIVAGASLSTTEGGLDGSNSFRLDESSPNGDYPAYIDGSKSGPSALVVYGTLALDNDDARGSGLYISAGTSVTVANTGSVFISNDGDSDDAIRVKGGSLTNNGTVTIANPGEFGIKTSGGNSTYLVVNNGMLTISGGSTGIELGSVFMENNGTLIVAGTTGKILTGSGDFRNNGILGGNGIIEADNDFILQPGSIISPGASPGTLIFENGSRTINLNGVTLQMEIDGPGAGLNYDQIQITGSGALNLAGSVLQLSGSYVPVMGDQFFLAISTGGGNINGTFSGGPFQLNEVLLKDISSGGLEFEQALPVELISFTVKAAGKEAELRWATATEINNDYFAIEHSTDGRHFTEIGRVGGAGTTQQEQRYAFLHRSPAKGLNYYRLKQCDYDGASEYSPIQSVLLEGDNSWAAWPTLARDLVAIEWAEALESEAAVEVFNLAGRKMFSQEAPARTAKMQIPVADWAPGLYWVLVKDRGEMSAQPFVKE